MEEHIEQRLSSLRVMLLKMLAGSYYQRIKRSKHNDILESFILGFNVLAEEFQDVLVHLDRTDKVSHSQRMKVSIAK